MKRFNIDVVHPEVGPEQRVREWMNLDLDCSLAQHGEQEDLARNE